MHDQSFIQVRVDTKLKQEALAVLDEIGMDMPNAIRMFLKRIVLVKGLPFDARLPEFTLDNSEGSGVACTPAKAFKIIPAKEWIDLLCTVPTGKITRYCDIEDYYRMVYREENIALDQSPYPYHPSIPFWRVISKNGMLQEVAFRCSKEKQREALESEGLKIVFGGKNNKSLKVENYKEYLFNFENTPLQKITGHLL